MYLYRLVLYYTVIRSAARGSVRKAAFYSHRFQVLSMIASRLLFQVLSMIASRLLFQVLSMIAGRLLFRMLSMIASRLLFQMLSMIAFRYCLYASLTSSGQLIRIPFPIPASHPKNCGLTVTVTPA